MAATAPTRRGCAGRAREESGRQELASMLGTTWSPLDAFGAVRTEVRFFDEALIAAMADLEPREILSGTAMRKPIVHRLERSAKMHRTPRASVALSGEPSGGKWGA